MDHSSIESTVFFSQKANTLVNGLSILRMIEIKKRHTFQYCANSLFLLYNLVVDIFFCFQDIKNKDLLFQFDSVCRKDRKEWDMPYIVGMRKFLKSQDIKCKSKEFLQGFRLIENNSNKFPLYRYEFTCCKLKMKGRQMLASSRKV